MIKLLIGGSPCTYWSVAQKNGRETEPSGIGWELFKNYLIAKEKWKPDYFLYENNKSAAQAIKDQIAQEFGVFNPGENIVCQMNLFDNGVRMTHINSALVSAQNRQRFYVTNFGDIEQPENRGILLKDVLEYGFPFGDSEICERTLDYGCDKARPVLCNYAKNSGVSESSLESRLFCGNREKQQCDLVAERLSDEYFKGMLDSGEGKYRNGDQPSLQYRVYSCEDKSPTVVACSGGNLVPKVMLPGTVYEVKDGKISINGKLYSINLPDGFYNIRRLTVRECMRLQTIPEWFVFPVSKTQAYRQIGNGFTIEVIKFILSHIPNILDEDIEVLSMYDGMSCGQIALKEMGCHVVKYTAYEIDKFAIQTTQHNFPGTIQRGDAFQVREEGWSC